MGHTETFQFVDPRDGEYGVAYSAPTKELLRERAELIGYLGNFKSVITAYPPRPTGRIAESVELDENGEIPF